MVCSSPITRARGFLVILLTVGALGMATIAGRQTPALAAAASSAPSRDIDMYAAIVDRIRTGQPYHLAVGTELRQRHYPTIPVFNWRTPLLYSVLARVPEGAGRVVLVGLAFVVLGATVIVLVGRSPAEMIVGLLFQVGATVPFLVAEAVVMSEAWAGVLVGLSLCAYLKGVPRAGAALALLGLFVRELVAPWAVLCAVLALRARRKGEVAIWLGGAVAYAAYYAWHYVAVSSLLEAGDFAHQHSWLYGGGIPFVLNTLRMNAILLVSPPWVSAAVLALLVSACVSPSTKGRLRAAVTTYLGFFLVAGQPFNYYWGLITVAVWPLALAEGVGSLRAAVRSIREPSTWTDQNPSTRPIP